MAKSKKILACLLASMLALSAPMTAAAAWQKDAAGVWSWTENGAKATGWRSIGGKWYYFDASGNMKTGWQKVNGTWYYLNESGNMATGWKQLNGTWYYLNESGDMATGWKMVNGTWYYLNQSGDMATGWKQVNNNWYHLKDWGGMTTGWLWSGGHWYYLDPWGAMATNWRLIDNTWYYMDASGVMQTGFFTVGGKTYFANGSGEMQSGVVQIDGETYYFGDSGDGSMKTGVVRIGGTTYVFDDDGTALGRPPQAEVAYIITDSGQIIRVDPERVPSGGGSGGSGGGSVTTPEEPTIEEKVEEVLKDAIVYEYNDSYTPTGTATIDGTNVTYTYTPDDLSYDGTGTHPIVADLARFLGALYRVDEESEGAEIVYDKTTYTWDEDKGLTGSNWVDADGNTLVSAITADLAEAVQAGKEATLTFTYRGVEITATTEINSSITVSDETELKVALANPLYTEIKLNNNIELSEALNINRAVTIDGAGNTLSMTNPSSDVKVLQILTDGVVIDNVKVDAGLSNPATWSSNYAIQVYNAEDVILRDVTATGANGGIQVNGSDVTLEGTIDVSGNGFGGIEVNQGVSAPNAAALNVGSATLYNSSESNTNPTIWIDVKSGTTEPGGSVTGGTLYSVAVLKKNQTYFFLDKGYADTLEANNPSFNMGSAATAEKVEELFTTNDNGLVTGFDPAGMTPVQASLTKGNDDYSNVLIKVSVTSGNGEKLQLIAKDTANNYYDVVKAGQWGPSGGFPLATATTNFYIVSNVAGDYTVQVDLVDVSRDNLVLRTATVTITIEESETVSE